LGLIVVTSAASAVKVPEINLRGYLNYVLASVAGTWVITSANRRPLNKKSEEAVLDPFARLRCGNKEKIIKQRAEVQERDLPREQAQEPELGSVYPRPSEWLERLWGPELE
jgi:hypothetical protein